MKSYKPSEHSETANVAPLVQFFELVHIGDTIQSMVQVYFEKELVSRFVSSFLLMASFLLMPPFLSSPPFLLRSLSLPFAATFLTSPLSLSQVPFLSSPLSLPHPHFFLSLCLLSPSSVCSFTQLTNHHFHLRRHPTSTKRTFSMPSSVKRSGSRTRWTIRWRLG